MEPLIASSHRKLDTFLNPIVEFLPKLILFVVILVVGFILARLVKAAIAKALEAAGLDRQLHSGQSGQYVEKISPGASPSKLIGSVAYYLIVLATLGIAISTIGGSAADNFIGAIVGYLPNVVVAVLIFVLAGAIAAAVGGLVARTMGDTPTGKVIGSVVPILVMAIATFMILDQLKIAEDIVRITYMAVMFSLALGMALAFGLGGRELAAEALRSATDKGKEQQDQVKQDLRQGREQAQHDAQLAREKAEQRMGGGGADGTTEVQTQYPPPPGR